MSTEDSYRTGTKMMHRGHPARGVGPAVFFLMDHFNYKQSMTETGCIEAPGLPVVLPRYLRGKLFEVHRH